MIVSYSSADQFCHGMTYREWRDQGNTGRCPYHAKMLRNFNKAEAHDIAKRCDKKAFLCPLSGKWHLANGTFNEQDFEVGDGE